LEALEKIIEVQSEIDDVCSQGKHEIIEFVMIKSNDDH
jgi:hypothetical protein